MGVLHIAGLNDANGEVFPTVPAGSYKARITNVEEKVSGSASKNPGSPMIKFTVKLVDDAAQGQTLFMNVMLPTEHMDEDQKNMSINRIKRVAIACAVPVTDEFDTSDLMGQEFKAVVSLQEKDGVKKNDIKDQLPL